MNFLAHFYLSGDNPSLMTGNLIGDFVKGRNALAKFDIEIVKGIELHRAIDAFTDTNQIVTQSKDRLRTKYRHYSGVIVDVFYDHFLAVNWHQYHREPLAEYTKRVYKIVNEFSSLIPVEASVMLTYMMRDNWLASYASISGIHRALTGMSRRTPYQSWMEEASADLTSNYDAFKKEFETFFPLLIAHCERKIMELNQARA